MANEIATVNATTGEIEEVESRPVAQLVNTLNPKTFEESKAVFNAVNNAQSLDDMKDKPIKIIGVTQTHSVRVDRSTGEEVPCIGTTLVGAFLGAWAVTLISPDFLRKLLPFILLGVLGYTLAKKELGRDHEPRLAGRTEMLTASAIGLLIGFYDGFFGPGTGSFFVFLFVRLLGYDFLNASASAKLLNLASNAAALLLFTLKGHVWWHFAIPLAVANVLGSMLGTWMALRHGTGFVRTIFIGVVSLLILKTGYDAFLR